MAEAGDKKAEDNNRGKRVVAIGKGLKGTDEVVIRFDADLEGSGHDLDEMGKRSGSGVGTVIGPGDKKVTICHTIGKKGTKPTKDKI